MRKPRLLDLFCCAGGAAMGYSRAGFEVVGVDIAPQRHYPFEFIQADALTFPLEGFDAIHASPPCQLYSVTKHSHSVEYPDLVGPVRERLIASGLPWILENVVGAPLIDPLTVCGSSFGLMASDLDGQLLVLKRHRLFESNIDLVAPDCACKVYRSAGIRIGGVYGGGPSNRDKSWKRGGYTPPQDVRRSLMGVDWTNGHELNESIPPAYTLFLGWQLRRHIEKSNA